MVERFLKQTQFSSFEDYNEHLEFIIPEHFNFAYDVMDVWAEEKPDGLALLWTNDEGEERRTTFAQLKSETDRAAAYLQSLGICKGDPVMLILKRRYEWWIAMLALHKLGAVVIPATHMLTKHDIIYRNTRASVKAIICVDDPYVMSQIEAAMPESPTVKTLIKVAASKDAAAKGAASQPADRVSDGLPIGITFLDWHSGIDATPAAPFTRIFNDNGDTMLMYFTSGTSG